MAKIRRDQWLVPSIVDRLIDDGGSAGSYNLRALKESVRRDLENLLNTRRRYLQWPAEYEELDQSLYAYGVPDPTGTNASSTEEKRDFLRTIERVVRRFEPRFKSVRVTMPEGGDDEDRIFRFRIEGLLHAEPAPEPAMFETEIEPVSKKFEIQSIG